MPLYKGFMARKVMINSSHAVLLSSVSLGIIAPTSSLAQNWDRESAGTFIYQRDVPTQPAQIVGEAAPAAQVVLTGPDSPFDAIMHLREPLSDLEAGAISGQASMGLHPLLPAAPSSGTDPQDIVGYSGGLAAAVTSATQGTLAQTVTQATGILTDATTAITSAIGKLPAPGSY